MLLLVVRNKTMTTTMTMLWIKFTASPMECCSQATTAPKNFRIQLNWSMFYEPCFAASDILTADRCDDTASSRQLLNRLWCNWKLDTNWLAGWLMENSAFPSKFSSERAGWFNSSAWELSHKHLPSYFSHFSRIAHLLERLLEFISSFNRSAERRTTGPIMNQTRLGFEPDSEPKKSATNLICFFAPALKVQR